MPISPQRLFSPFPSEAYIRIREAPTNELFHYTTPAGLLGIASDRKIRATHVQLLNDATELKHAIGLGVAELKGRIGGMGPARKLVVERAITLLETRQRAYLGLTSFSEKGDQLSQWRGYCAQGGYSLGFSPSVLLATAKANKATLAKCIYDESEQRDFIRAIADSFIPTIVQSDAAAPDQRAVTVVNSLMRVVPLMKHPSFQEEQEWRMFRHVSATAGWQFRTTNNLLIPYLEFKLCADLQGNLFSRVIAGPHDHQRTLAVGANLLNLNRGSPWSTFEWSKIPYRTLHRRS